jgi:hypothetical protein
VDQSSELVPGSLAASLSSPCSVSSLAVLLHPSPPLLPERLLNHSLTGDLSPLFLDPCWRVLGMFLSALKLRSESQTLGRKHASGWP